MDNLTLTDGLTAYGEDPTDPLLPVGELTRLLEMDVDVLPNEKRIVGRLGEARRSLVVDLATSTMREGGRNLTLAPADVAVSPSDIYLRASVLRRLLPMKLQVNAEGLSIEVQPTEPLPIQSRMDRVARRRETVTARPQEEVMRVPTEYRLATAPSFDVVLGAGVQTEAPRLPFRYDIRIGADLFYSGFQGYLGSDETGRLASARVLFERRSPQGGILGPLKVRTLAVGDVYTPTLPLGARGVGGRGFAISTVPLDETNIFNRVDLRGELPLGYDVELYVNDILRSGQNTPAKGRYEFMNVPLSQGINVVRVVLYGPRGERTEETRVVNVGAGLLPRGQANFEFGVVQQDEEVLRIRPPSGEDELGGNPGRGGFRAVGSVNYGLTSYLTVSGGAALIPTLESDDYRGLVMAGARTSLLGFATQLDVAVDDRQAAAAALGVAGQLFGVSTVVRHAAFRGSFIDENGPSSSLTRAMEARTELTFDGSLSLRGQIVPLSVRLLRSAYSDGTSEFIGAARGSGSAGGFLFSGGLEYQRQFGVGDLERLSGFVAASTFRSFRWQIRSTVDFDVLPEFKARTLAITADRDLSTFASLRLGVGQSLEDYGNFNVSAAAIFRLSRADLSISSEYSNADQSWRLAGQLSFGLGYNPARGRYVLTRPGPAGGGSVLFEAFLDRNGNGIFDGDDEPVPGVALEGVERKAVTGPDGRAFVTGVSAATSARLNVNIQDVQNTSVQTPPSTIQFSPRGGSFTTIRYPMKPTGEVMVHLRLLREDGSKVGLSAARLLLVGDNGYTAEASTEFDGSVLFEKLPRGNYRLEIDADQARRLRMRLAEPVSVSIKGDGGFVPDAQAEVRFEARVADAATENAQSATVEKQ